MSLKIELVERAAAGESISALSREFGVSRMTAHKWIKRFKEQGHDGLDEQSRRPKSAPLTTAEDVVLAVLQAREAHPRWGPRKLHAVLIKSLRESTPSARTIARILKRANKVRERRRRPNISIIDRAPSVAATSPNDVWTVDFKGYWRSRDGVRCDPLTVRDAHSRFVLAAEICAATTVATMAVFERLFHKHGLPKAIQCDNGVPFIAVNARGGLSVLSAWWLSLGIKVIRSRVGCPQDNGAHERMHRDLAADVQAHPAANRAEQQRQLSRWRQQFNHVRPHEALGNKTPADVYGHARGRPFRAMRYEYPASYAIRRVMRNGVIKLNEEPYFIGRALHGHYVAVQMLDPMHARIWLCDVDLGTIELLPDLHPPAFDLTDRRKRSAAA